MALRRTVNGEVLVQRCVILHRDENGYGLTVSGDNPVYVQSVKENSGASKAGVQVHDKIIKVNGTLVTNSNHVEVVNLIKGGSYVALTLLGKSPGEKSSPQNSGSVDKAPRPQSLGSNISKVKLVDSDEPKPDSIVSSLQRNLDQEKIFFQKIREQYVQGPSQQSQKELADSQIRIRALEDQIKAIASGPSKGPFLSGRTVARSVPDSGAGKKPFQTHQRSQSVQGTRTNPLVKQTSLVSSDYPPTVFDSPTTKENQTAPEENDKPDLFRQISETKIDYESVPAEKVEKPQKVAKRSVSLKTFSKFYDRPPPSSPKEIPKIENDEKEINHVRSKSEDDDESVSSVTSAKRPYMPNHVEEEEPKMDNLVSGGKIEHLQPIYSAVSVISMEDEEFESDNEKIDDHGPFLDLNKLKRKPAHLSVFLHFLMSNSDPSALFFWLVTETYAKEDGSLKDLKKWAYEIFSTFLASSAPMKVCIPESTEQTLEENLRSKSLSGEDFRNLFRPARAFAFSEVSEQLAEFRNKRSLGLGSLFGDHQLEDNLDKDKELKVVEQTLLPHLEALTVEVESDSKESLQYAKNSAMASALTTFMKHVGVTVKGSGSQTNPLDRHKSFAEKERSSLWKFKHGKKAMSVKGHQFVGMQYTESTLCNCCDGLLWGIGIQGLQCQACGYNVHKGACTESIEEPCTGMKSKVKVMNKAGDQKPFGWKITGRDKQDAKQKNGGKEGGDETDSFSLNTSAQQAEISRSRGSSFADDQSEKGSSNQISEEQTLSDQEPDKNLNKSTGSFDEQSLSVEPTRERESKKSRANDLKKNNLQHSQSVRSQREFVKLIEKDRKKTLSALPGLRMGLRTDGLNTDNGVNTTHPFPGRVDSPPLSDDADDDQDDDLDAESEVPNLSWSQMVDKKVIKKLKDKEVKRQEVIHELINTEKTHVRNLKVLEKVFLKPMKKKQIMPTENIQQIFPNLEELIEIHTSLLADMNARCAEQGQVIGSIADVMLARFDGTPGEKAKETTASFHHDQKIANEMLKSRIKKDPKLAAFMARQEESRYCRRLKFNDIMATTHQRLTKYPLLLREILKGTPASNPEYKDLEKCQRCCKDILNHVNESIAESENRWRLIELSKKIDKKALEGNTKIFEEFKDFDLTRYKLMHEGDLIWKISRTKTIELHVLLLDLYMVLLQKQDDKLLLKSHSTTLSTGNQDMKTTHSPIIKLQNLLTRDVATDKHAFFLVSTSSVGPQIYELVTATITERNTWVKVITDCVESSLRKGKERGRRGALCLTSNASLSESVDEQKSETEDEGSSKSTSQRGDAEVDQKQTEQVDTSSESKHSEVMEEKPKKKVIDPPSKERLSEIYEHLRIKDDEIKKMLEDKARMVAEIRCEPFEPTILPEMSTSDSQAEARELVLAAILQANRLTLAVSEIFNMHRRTDSNGLIDTRAHSSSSPVFTNGLMREESMSEDEQRNQRPQEVLIEATTSLNEQLTSLLSVITDEENSKERLQSDLQSAQANMKKLAQTSRSGSALELRELSEPPDIHPSTSTPSLGTPTPSLGTPTPSLGTPTPSVGTPTRSLGTPTPGILVSDDNSEEGTESSNRSEVFDEPSKNSEEVSQSSPVSLDPVFLTNPFRSPKPRTSGEADEITNDRIERSSSFSGGFSRPVSDHR